MNRRRATRLGALAGVLAVVGLVPFAQFVEAGELEDAGTEVISDGPVGVLVLGPGTTPIEEPAPSDDPPPSNEPAPGDTSPPPSGGSATSPLGAMVGAPRPPQRAAVRSNPTATVTPVASGAQPATKGRGMSLEDIFLNNRSALASPASATPRASRSLVGMPHSSLPSMVMTTLLAMLAALLLAARQLGTSFFVNPVLGRSIRRRSAPRGWRVVATAVAPQAPAAPMAPTLAATMSPMEQPVLAASEHAATRSR